MVRSVHFYLEQQSLYENSCQSSSRCFSEAEKQAQQQRHGTLDPRGNSFCHTPFVYGFPHKIRGQKGCNGKGERENHEQTLHFTFLDASFLQTSLFGVFSSDDALDRDKFNFFAGGNHGLHAWKQVQLFVQMHAMKAFCRFGSETVHEHDTIHGWLNTHPRHTTLHCRYSASVNEI